jgi:hypothetical protein
MSKQTNKKQTKRRDVLIYIRLQTRRTAERTDNKRKLIIVKVCRHVIPKKTRKFNLFTQLTILCDLAKNYAT